MSDARALLFDIGNTRLKWAVTSGKALKKSGIIEHEKLSGSGFAALTTRLPTAVDAVLASNVAGPSFATRLSGVIGMHCGKELHFARSKATAFGMTNSYRQPRRLGVDRWVAMIGARDEFRGALCVVDAGTAVTIDAVDSKGQHLGGQILPGLRLMTEALNTDTSDLPAVRRAPKQWAEPLQAFASSTGTAIYNGAIGAISGSVERAVRLMRKGGYRPTIVLTGGDASRILGELDGRVEHRPNLVLQGLAVMVQNGQ